jgi:NADH-quinone oxidoreductase subunit H
MMTCLKYLLPISCVLLLGVSLWMVAVPAVVMNVLKYVLAIGSVGLLALMIVKIATTFTKLPSEGVRGVWTPGAAPHYELLKKT